MTGYDPYLSKTLYIKGCQCHKALWLKKYRPELADETSPEQQALFDSGTDVGILAQQLFPGGVLIPYEGLSMTEQLSLTTDTIANGTKTLYEATFSYDEIFFKADIMNLTANGWNLYEVKASTSVKDVYLEDVSLQRHVLAGAGIRLNRAHVIHINNQYVRKGDINIHELFSIVDITEQTEPLLTDVANRISDLRKMLQLEMPLTDIGPHCNDPYLCEFSGHCWQHVPTPSVFDIARIGKKAFSCYSKGIMRLEEVPDELLNAKQQLQKRLWIEKKEQLVPQKLRSFLDSLQYPLTFMDFETFSSPVPRYDNTRPYGQMPFQYSLHIADSDDAPIREAAFLSDGTSTPQNAFINSLLSSVPQTGSVIVWNQAFEKSVLRNMQKSFPLKRQEIQDVIDRIVDLMVPFRNNDYNHWQFQGSYSIKKVLPVLVPDLSYDSLVIQNGGMAPIEWFRMTQLDDPIEKQSLSEQLLAYCRLDTFAMVRILQEIRNKVSTSYDD